MESLERLPTSKNERKGERAPKRVLFHTALEGRVLILAERPLGDVGALEERASNNESKGPELRAAAFRSIDFAPAEIPLGGDRVASGRPYLANYSPSFAATSFSMCATT